MCVRNCRPQKRGHKCTYQLTFIAASCGINQTEGKFHSSDISIYELAVDSAPRAPTEYIFVIMFRKRVFTQQISINIYSMLILPSERGWQTSEHGEEKLLQTNSLCARLLDAFFAQERAMCLTIRFVLRALPEAIEEMNIISDRFF